MNELILPCVISIHVNYVHLKWETENIHISGRETFYRTKEDLSPSSKCSEPRVLVEPQ